MASLNTSGTEGTKEFEPIVGNAYAKKSLHKIWDTSTVTCLGWQKYIAYYMNKKAHHKKYIIPE